MKPRFRIVRIQKANFSSPIYSLQKRKLFSWSEIEEGYDIEVLKDRLKRMIIGDKIDVVAKYDDSGNLISFDGEISGGHFGAVNA